jgi:hypothetical protein
MKRYLAKDENGVRVDARDAEKGQNYRCPGCHKPLILAKGKVRAHHFKHRAHSPCNHPHIGDRHVLAQDLIMETRHLPDLYGWGERLDLSHAEIIKEHPTFGFRIDLYVEIRNGRDEGLRPKNIWIEVRDTSPCSPAKIEAAERLGIDLFEVDVSGLDVKDVPAFKAALNCKKRWKPRHPDGQQTLDLPGGSAKPGKPLANATGMQFADCRIRRVFEDRQMSLPFAQAAFQRLRDELLQLWLGIIFGLTFFASLFRRQ